MKTVNNRFATTVRYKNALRRIQREGVHQSHVDLLRAHFVSPARTVSWRELAQQVGYANAEAVKLQYGSFARRVAQHLGIETPPGFWLKVLAAWGPKPDQRGHTTFTLRPEVVRALQELNWFSRSGPSKRIGIRSLHVVQAGIANGDKQWLEHAALRRVPSRLWIVPQSAVVGDDVVFYVGGLGLFATGRIASSPRPRRDWARRYGSAVTAIELIRPPVSFAAVRRHVSSLTWSRYPRSITTPPRAVAAALRELIALRRRTGVPDLDDDALDSANIEELRRVALLRASASLPAKRRSVLRRAASTAIRLYVLRRADGRCEGCGAAAPFITAAGLPYLEPHHTRRRSDDGPDHPACVIAVCPNCHRRAHHSIDAFKYNARLIRRAKQLER
jgi:hypothetical protein